MSHGSLATVIPLEHPPQWLVLGAGAFVKDLLQGVQDGRCNSSAEHNGWVSTSACSPSAFAQGSMTYILKSLAAHHACLSGSITREGEKEPAMTIQRSMTIQRTLIENQIREHLQLPADALLGATERAQVTTLRFGSELTDVGAAMPADPATGLTALTKLHVYGCMTDTGVAALAAPDTGLKALTELSLDGTGMMEAGVAALASPDTGLKALTSLYLGDTKVTDAGVAALAAPDTGLKALTELNLSHTQVTDAGVAALAAKDSGLKALTLLWLSGTVVTDDGIAKIKERFPEIFII